MTKLSIIICLIMAIVIASPGLAADKGFAKFRMEVKEALDNRKPDIILQSEALFIVIVSMKDVMKKFTYYKHTDTYEVKDIRKFSDSTKSLFHQTPSERLKEAIEIYGRAQTN